MPGKRGAPPAGAARGGDDCHDPSMPELVDIQMFADELRENTDFQPNFTLLTQLEEQYRQALTTPSMSETIRTNILARIVTDDVKVIVYPILRKIFVSLPEDYREVILHRKT